MGMLEKYKQDINGNQQNDKAEMFSVRRHLHLRRGAQHCQESEDAKRGKGQKCDKHVTGAARTECG